RTGASRTGDYSAAWLSTNGGTAWTRLKIPADHGAGTTISGVASDGAGLIAVRPGRTAAGTPDGSAHFSAGGRPGQYGATLEAAADGTVRSVSLAGIAGATIPEMKINSTAVAGGMQIAVGSANGYPAVWLRTSAGAWALVSSLGLVAADPHLRALTSVTHGPAGWLAAGAPGPVVLTSADGEIWGVAGGDITQNLAGV